MEARYRLTAVEPTVFFERAGDALRQRVRVRISGGQAAGAGLRITGAGIHATAALTATPAEPGVYEALIPDLREPAEVTFALEIEGRAVDTLTRDWAPQRHWEVYLVHYAHHDLGYTDLPSNVLREYDAFYDSVLGFCTETESWPDGDARFRYLVEQAWSIVHWVENRPPEMVERLMHYVRSEQIEITALFGNQTLELCGHEELVRLLYPAFALAKRYHFDIVSAEHNDIPGFPWALASVLHGAGIRYFSPGVPAWYFGDAHPLWDTTAFLPIGRPAACWWEGPDGHRVLLWSDLHGQEWQPYDVTQAVAELPEMLAGLEGERYPYDMVSYTLRGGHRDNAPPTLRYAHMVREWNARWAYPRLINATNRLFLSRFEAAWGATLPTFRGDVPGTDYPIAASCTPKETAIDRATHDDLRAAELWATLATEVTGETYPRATLNEAWRETFYYDLHCWGFHDVGGPAQDAHWNEKAARAYRAAALAHDVAVKAADRLAGAVSLAGDGVHLTVFNPLGHRRTDLVLAPLRPWDPCGSPMYWSGPGDDRPWPTFVSGPGPGRKLFRPPADLFERPFHLIDVATGASLPYQLMRLDDPQAAEPWAPERAAMARMAEAGVEGMGAYVKQLAFVARDLPPAGYRTYRIEPCDDWPVFEPACRATAEALESPFYRVDLDPATGTVINVHDHAAQRALFEAGAEYAPGAEHSPCALLVRDAGSAAIEPARAIGITALESGPVFARVRVTAAATCAPRIVRELWVYGELNRVDVAFRILRDATPMKELYVAFPFDVPDPAFRFEAGNAVIRPILDQVPGSSTDAYTVQHWVAVEGTDTSIVWSARDTPIAALGGLWPGYVSQAHHGVAGPGYGHPFLKEGEITKGHIYALVSYNNFRTNFINARPDEYVVRYAFTSGAAGESRFGWGVMTAPQPVWGQGPRAGSLAPLGSFVELRGQDGGELDTVVLVALKQAEDSAGIVVRLWETAGRATDVTLRTPLWTLHAAHATDLVEGNPTALPVRDGAVQVHVEPYAFATICLRTKQVT